MRRRLLLLWLALFPPSGVASAAVCTSTASFAWHGPGTGAWSCGPGTSADAYVVASGHTVTLAQSATLSGAGGISVQAGGAFVARGSYVLAPGSAGLACAAGSSCTLEGTGFRALGGGEPPVRSTLDGVALARVQEIVPCPASGGGSDCGDPTAASRVRLRFPSPPPGLGRIDPGDVLCFGEADPGAGRTSPDAGFCYEVKNDPESTAPAAIDLDVTQSPSGRNAAGFPLAWRRIRQASVLDAGGVRRGGRSIRVSGSVLSASHQLVGRWLRFADAAGAPEAQAYKIMASDDGGSGDDVLRIGDLRGFTRDYPAGRSVWIDYGWTPGDGFYVWSPLRVRSATASETDSQLSFGGDGALRRVLLDGLGAPDNGIAVTGALRIASNAAPTAVEDVWLADPATPPAGISIMIGDVTGLTLRRIQQTGGTSSEAGCAPYTAACADYLHVFGFRGAVRSLRLEDVAVRHHGDDVLLNAAAIPFQLTVERLHAASVSRYASSGNLLDGSGLPGAVVLRDVVCDDCTSPPDGTNAAGGLFSGLSAVTGSVEKLLAFGTRGGVGCDFGPICENIVAIGSEGEVGYFAGGRTTRAVVRDVRYTGASSGLANSNRALELYDALIRDSSYGNQQAMNLPTGASAPITVENAVLLDVNGPATSYVWNGGVPAAPVRLRHVSAVWSGPHTTDRLLTTYGTDSSAFELDSILVQGLDGPAEIALVVALAQIAAPGRSCFFDDTLFWPASQVPAVPPSWVFSNALPPEAPPRSPAFPWTQGLGCGAQGVVGVSAPLWLHGKSRLVPEFFGDADGDGIPSPSDDCGLVADPAQADTDGDGIGDPCDDTCGGGTTLLLAEVVPDRGAAGSWIELRSIGVNGAVSVEIGGLPAELRWQAGVLQAKVPALGVGRHRVQVVDPAGCRSQELASFTVLAGCGLLGPEALALLALGLLASRRPAAIAARLRARTRG